MEEVDREEGRKEGRGRERGKGEGWERKEVGREWKRHK